MHRPKYDDWSWSKGKLDGNEQWPVAAVRETFEETGLQVRLGSPLPETKYRVLGRDGRPALKQVRYWTAQVTGGTGMPVNEIDEVAWLEPARAYDRLDYEHDREQLRAVEEADEVGALATWPLLVVRHALARPRSSWKRADRQRPLVGAGRERAGVVADLLGAYGVREVVTSPAKRCLHTVLPYADAAGIEPVLKAALSEEVFERKGADPALRVVDRLLEGGTPAAVCTHGPVLPALLKSVRVRVDRDTEPGRSAYGVLTGAVRGNLDKGEALVAHVTRAGDQPHVVAVERHRL